MKKERIVYCSKCGTVLSKYYRIDENSYDSRTGKRLFSIYKVCPNRQPSFLDKIFSTCENVLGYGNGHDTCFVKQEYR